MPQSDQSTQSSDALGSSASTSGVAGTGSDNSQQRINDLMSKWQSEQAATTRLQTEVTRLQGLLATAVSTEADLRQQLQAAQTGQQQAVTDAEGRAGAAESKVAELETRVATLTAENSRLTYIQANPDLAPYAAILPDTADTTTLEAAARTIRDARQSGLLDSKPLHQYT
jgi:DNA repair exonuclease SbcCD ATPase subunit